MWKFKDALISWNCYFNQRLRCHLKAVKFGVALNGMCNLPDIFEARVVFISSSLISSVSLETVKEQVTQH